MTDLVNNVETEFIEWVVGGVDVRVAHADVYVALHTADPGESPDGSTEVDSGTTNYTRQQTAAGTAWNITGNEGSNANEISFPTATESWGTISHFSIWDGAATTDNPLATDVIRDSNGNATTKTVDMDDTISFSAGTLTVTID